MLRVDLPIIWHCSVTASPSVTIADVKWLAITGGLSLRLWLLDTSTAIVNK